MLKGCQRKAIVVRGDADCSFEAAYFIMRVNKAANVSEEDMLSEARRIVERSQGSSKLPKRSFIKEALKFVGGMICGGGIVGLIWVLLI